MTSNTLKIKSKAKRKYSTQQLTKIALSAALYFVVSMAFKPFAFGHLEFRVAEMLNFLMFVDPVFIVGITLGCALTNMFTFGIMDIFFGAGATFIVGILMWKSKKMWMGIIISTIGVFPIAWELYFFFGLPFWYTFGTGAAGEFISITVGYFLAKRMFREKKIVELLKATPGNDKEVINVK